MMTSDLWQVYVLLCSDGTYYTGATNNVQRRLKAHNSKKGAKYTRSRTPCSLIAQIGHFDKSVCLRVERRFKMLSRPQKTYFIKMGLESFLETCCMDLFPKNLNEHDRDGQRD